jgi:uncharacterized protein (DUF362 family)
MKRRKFIKTTGLLGATAAVGMSGLPGSLKAFGPANWPDIAIVEGTDLFLNAKKSIDAIGGISKFISKQDIVGLLINGDFEKAGTFVRPEIPLAVIDECYAAGAKEIVIFQHLPDNYWERTGISSAHSEIIESLSLITSNRFPAEYNLAEWTITNEVKGAVHIKELEIIRAVYDCDKFINIPISKHHNGTLYTGTLKNMMGLLTRKSNVVFHLGSGHKNDPEYLGQCIADLNLVRKPDLVVMDSSEFLVSNGPAGPGELDRLDYVVAGTDPVAVDVVGAEFVGFNASEVITIQKASDHGLGEIDISKLKIETLKG